MKHKRIREALFSTPWLITKDALLQVLAIANYEGDIEALATKRSKPLEETKTAFVRDGIAHIPISGPIFPKANLMTEISGATSLSTVITDFQAALDNEEVTSIVLDIDSPGGVAKGINEAANIIKASEKHVTAYVSGSATSAAYWLASAANEIVVDAIANLGGIGVVAAFNSKSDGDKIEIVSSNAPNKRPDLDTEEGKAVIRGHIDDMESVFISTIAENRNVSIETVKSSFGKGGIVVGEKAVAVGMADRLGSFESLMVEKSQLDGGYEMNKKDSVVTLDILKVEHPDVYQAAVNEGKAEASATFESQLEEAKKTNLALVKENTELKTISDDQGKRLVALEKNDLIRAEKDLKLQASAIVDTALSSSTVPDRLHKKVKGFISHDAYVEEGVLNVESFTESVNAEIKDWEESTKESSVAGLGTQSHSVEGITDDVNDSEAEALSDNLLSLVVPKSAKSA